MTVTIKKILEEFPVSLDIDSMEEKLLNYEISKINLENIHKPTEYKEKEGDIGYIFKTNKNHVITISQHSIGETWKDEYGQIHTLYIDDTGNIINT